MTTQASWKSEIFQATLNFLPDWLQYTAIGLAVGGFLVFQVVKWRRGRALRRALGPITPIPDAPDGARGADYLGAYAPQQPRNDATT
jgi:hypothetical protein